MFINTFEITVVACSETQLADGSSSIKFNHARTSPSAPQVIRPPLRYKIYFLIYIFNIFIYMKKKNLLKLFN